MGRFALRQSGVKMAIWIKPLSRRAGQTGSWKSPERELPFLFRIDTGAFSQEADFEKIRCRHSVFVLDPGGHDSCRRGASL
jgi:hypothetical protein